MAIPNTGFVLLVTRERLEQQGAGPGTRHRTVGSYKCFLDGVELLQPNLRGASVEPRGPGDNSQTGVDNSRRVEKGKYPLGTHGFPGSKYHSFDYNKGHKPFPGIYVRGTDEREAILVHRGIGFKSTVGCINLTGSIVDARDHIGPNTSFACMDALIVFMKDNIAGFPAQSGKKIPGAVLVIDGNP